MGPGDVRQFFKHLWGNNRIIFSSHFPVQ